MSIEEIEDRAFQQRFWQIQRMSWIAMAIILLSAAFGFWGAGGYFAERSVSAGEATVTFPRVSRWKCSDQILISVPAGAPATIEFDRAFHEAFDIVSITPAPETQQLQPGGSTMRYAGAGGTVQINVSATRPDFGIRAHVRVNKTAFLIDPVILP